MDNGDRVLEGETLVGDPNWVEGPLESNLPHIG